MGQKCELHFESFHVAGALDSKGTFEYVQIQQVLLVLCFEREIVREQLRHCQQHCQERQEFLNNYIICPSHILGSVLNRTENYKYYIHVGWERLFL